MVITTDDTTPDYSSEFIYPSAPYPSPSLGPSTAASLEDLETGLGQLSINTMMSSPEQSHAPDSSITASKQEVEKTWSVQKQFTDISDEQENTLRIRVIQNQLGQLLEIYQQSSTPPVVLGECLGEIQTQLGRLIYQQDTSPEQIPKILRQPETRPISHEQLVAEVKGICAGLVMVEGKCIQVDAKQAAIAREAPPGQAPKVNNEQCRLYLALRLTLLHEYNDLFCASQHPSAAPDVRKSVIKYAMLTRLWHHGIYSYLELLRIQLPYSHDHMLAFIELCYSMVTHFYETLPAFELTWMEYLGNLGRYRMAIEDSDIGYREVWTQVARQWYLKALNLAPEVGRLYHHLAILARPNAIQQLFFYGKSLAVPQPFLESRDSVLSLFEPILSGTQTQNPPQVITVYIRIHALLFKRKNIQSFGENLEGFKSLLDSYISRVKIRFLELGYYIAISNCFVLLSYGSLDSVLSKAISAEDTVSTNETQTGTSDPFTEAVELSVHTLDINCKRIEDPNVLSFLHATLVFLSWLAQFPAAIQLLERNIFWGSLVHKLNYLLQSYHLYSRIEGDELPTLDKKDCRPTPEEFALRGLECAEQYFPPGWFENKNIEDENQYKEDTSMNTEYRPERILWLGRQLTKRVKSFTYNHEEHQFSLGPIIPKASSLNLGLCLRGIKEFPESSLVTACDDLEALNPLAKPPLQLDHNTRYHATCDCGGKATKANPITSPNTTSQEQTVANPNPNEPSKTEENKPAEYAPGQDVGFTGPTGNKHGRQLCNVKQEVEPNKGPDVEVDAVPAEEQQADSKAFVHPHNRQIEASFLTDEEDELSTDNEYDFLTDVSDDIPEM